MEGLGERLSGINSSARHRHRLFKKTFESEAMDTDDDTNDKNLERVRQWRKGTIFDKLNDKLAKNTLGISDNPYLKQLVFRSKKTFSNRDREINPGSNVPAPTNPNGNIISSFKYANTNDTLPRCSSIEQFNRELDERAQYELNNPHANSRKRNRTQAFDEIPDMYTEKDNYPSLKSFIKNPVIKKNKR